MLYLELFLTFFKIGLFTIGGGYAMLPLIQADVQAKGWMTAEELVNFIAVSESTPGPFAVNVSTYVGAELAAVIGMIGAAVVSVGQTVFLPEGLAAVTAYPLVCSLAIFALMAVLTHKKLHPIVIILLSALLGIVTGYLQPA